MSRPEPNKETLLKAVIADIDQLLLEAQQDLHQLNSLVKTLKFHRNAGNISDLHYTVDQERLRRTISKCKLLLLTLLEQRKRAEALLKE